MDAWVRCLHCIDVDFVNKFIFRRLNRKTEFHRICFLNFSFSKGIGGFGGCNLDDQEKFWQFMHGHSQLSKLQYYRLKDICGNSLHYGNETAKCNEALQAANVNLGGYNVYNIYGLFLSF